MAAPTEAATKAACKELDLRGRTITTAVAWAVHEQFAELEMGDAVELETDPFPAFAPDLVAWCRATGHVGTWARGDDDATERGDFACF